MQSDASVIKLDINLIIPNKYQPRKVFDDKALESLSESIKNYGIINPILVRKKEDKYEIIAGERRFRAAKRMGLTEVPVIVKNATEQQMAELALIENIQRQGLSPIEEAKSYEEIMRIGNQTQESLAKKLGKSQSTIANKIRLLSLPEEIQDALANKRISERHARSLISIEDKEKQLKLLNRIVKEKLTVKETEQLINEKEITEDEIKQAISDIMKSLNIQEDEEPSEETKKEEKEDDNMNNGNFFPNFDNNNAANNNASLNMMNMQSMNQQPMEAAPEMVMPTMAPVQEPQLVVPTAPVEMSPQMPSPEAPAMPAFEPFGPTPMGTPELTVPTNSNPMDGFMLNSAPEMPQNNLGAPTMPTMEAAPEMVMPTIAPVQEPQLVVPTAPVEMQPQMSAPEAPVMPQPLMDEPLFNPNVTMPTATPELTMPFGTPLEAPQPAPTGFEVPVMNSEPLMAPQVDKLTELQNLLSSNGYNYKIFSNETDNCVIIELPRN